MRNNLGADRFEAIRTRILARAEEIRKSVEDKLMADGRPPLTVKLDDRMIYENLTALMQANSPQFWDDPQAIQTYQRLLPRFGPPPAPGTSLPPYAQALGPETQQAVATPPRPPAGGGF
jgi:hypothetical protein